MIYIVMALILTMNVAAFTNVPLVVPVVMEVNGGP